MCNESFTRENGIGKDGGYRRCWVYRWQLMIANSLEMFRLLLDSGAGYEKSLPNNVYIELEVQVRLCCVPGHSNRAGNEEFDEITRREYKLRYVISSWRWTIVLPKSVERCRVHKIFTKKRWYNILKNLKRYVDVRQKIVIISPLLWHIFNSGVLRSFDKKHRKMIVYTYDVVILCRQLSTASWKGHEKYRNV